MARLARLILCTAGASMFWVGLAGAFLSLMSALFVPFMLIVAILFLILAGVGGILFWLS